MKIFFLVFSFFGLLIPITVFAVCPLCTFAVGAGIGLTQYLGIDDVISGMWIGGFIVSLIILSKHWLAKMDMTFWGYEVVITIFYYASTVVPLYLGGIIGHTLNKLWGIDRVLLGIIIGSSAFFIGTISYNLLKKHNNNRAYFPFQKIVMPVVPLVILSVLFGFVG